MQNLSTGKKIIQFKKKSELEYKRKNNLNE